MLDNYNNPMTLIVANGYAIKLVSYVSNVVTISYYFTFACSRNLLLTQNQKVKINLCSNWIVASTKKILILSNTRTSQGLNPFRENLNTRKDN